MATFPSDQSAAIAHWIMHAHLGPNPDPRDLIFLMYKIFWRASGEEFKRGMSIAVEVFEATEVGPQQGRPVDDGISE